MFKRLNTVFLKVNIPKHLQFLICHTYKLQYELRLRNTASQSNLQDLLTGAAATTWLSSRCLTSSAGSAVTSQTTMKETSWERKVRTHPRLLTFPITWLYKDKIAEKQARQNITNLT